MNMKKATVIALFAMVGLMANTAPGSAEQVTYTFTGTVGSVDPSLSGTFNTTMTLSGSFTYETTTPGVLQGTELNGLSSYLVPCTH
jgi:hypothetical protein